MRILVTGATGFLGGPTVARLAARGHVVRATGRDVRKGERLVSDRVTFVPGDLGVPRDVSALVEGVDVVVHSAALSSPWGPYEAFHRANVVATRALLGAAARAGVTRFVHVSTPSVFARPADQFALREDDAEPSYALNAYIATKRIAEREVRASSIPHVILRPRGIFGPGDTTLLPRLLRVLARGRLPVIGDGNAVVDLTYVDNVADAVVASVEANDAACGATYHVTNGEPIALWPLIGTLCDRLALPRPARRVPLAAAFATGAVLEAAAAKLPGAPEPPLTRYTATVLGCSTTLDITRAIRGLGYRPEVDMDEGIERFLSWWEVSRGVS